MSDSLNILQLAGKVLKGTLTHFVFVPIAGILLAFGFVLAIGALPDWMNDYVVPWLLLALIAWLVFAVLKGLWRLIKEDANG